MLSSSNKLIEDDSYEFDTRREAKRFIFKQVRKLTCLGLYKVYKKYNDYVILNSHDKQYSIKLEIGKDII
jgi:hypothetical protein